MKLFLTLFAGLAVTASAVRTAPAETPATPGTSDQATPAEPAKPEPYVLKKKSSFTLTEDFRPPFWPIGMKKKADAAPKAAPKVPGKVYKEPLLTAEYFKVTSIVMGARPSATLNGRSYLQGDIVPVVLEGNRINLTVRAVFDGGIQLAQGENVFVVPLRRQEPTPGQTTPLPEINSQSRPLELDASGGGKKTK